MVKNTHGGSGHKKFGRKFSTAAKSNRLRISEDEGEIYAIVTKMLGNGMFHCVCIDGEARLGHIRGKFSGRGKRDNMVEAGKWVLIGLREWDIGSDKATTTIVKGKEKLQKSDLLEVYSDADKIRLKETVVEDWIVLESNDVSRTTKELNIGDTEIMFASEKDEDRERLIAEMDSATTEKIVLKIGENKATEQEQRQVIDDEVFFDEI
jgi:initiation factor 1A